MSSPVARPAFHLDALDTRYAIFVEKPPRRPDHASADEAPWPLLLCLDGDDQFHALRQARAAAAHDHAIPPLLLVGVGYGAGYGRPGNRRVRDYTPCPIEGAPEGGGVGAFLDFLVNTLRPELDRRYPLSHDIRGLVGHSLGALPGLHALFHTPARDRTEPPFNRLLASAPSLWWGEGAIVTAATARQETGAPLPARVFLGIGSRDSASMRGDLARLDARLAARPLPGLEIRTETFADRNHHNSLHPAFRAGLAWLFH